MLLKTILNNCQKFKSFVYEDAGFVIHEGKKAIAVEIKPRKNSKIICSKCNTEVKKIKLVKAAKSKNDGWLPKYGFVDICKCNEKDILAGKV